MEKIKKDVNEQESRTIQELENVVQKKKSLKYQKKK